LALSTLAIVGDRSPGFKKVMTFYTPTGPLSGVTTTAIAVWLVSWLVLDAVMKRREVGRFWVFAGVILLAISFVLMFPPIGDLF
jgi:hypothetical protein